MPYSLEGKLVIAVASSALFDLSESDRVFREEGEDVYREYQRENEYSSLDPGVVFPLVKRLLSLNQGSADPLIEIVLFSRNDPDTGLRVFRSIEKYELPISRAVFTAGKNPFSYMEAFNASLFLTGNQADVEEALSEGLPAGVVRSTNYEDNVDDNELRLAFDFDGIIADDSSERIYKESGDLSVYQEHEKEHGLEAMAEGPLHGFLSKIHLIQSKELSREEDTSVKPKIRIAVITARNAPAHTRVVTTLRKMNIRVDEAIFLGGMSKRKVLDIYKPHIFFDDQAANIDDVAHAFPSAHIPYGITNKPK
ncbi:5'-nucleotidase [Salicibibacter cibi]|uniref:5'-nucleotidase n=1 Tax=Salicibibacter cibi TaxID=2743001 RepID=A0A7T6ZBT6_9BACI|nr:5'-nucleotidase [Salicibibacter cibi]QQK80410.1 5'-nucleotidase [Salicibibacter cibi]